MGRELCIALVETLPECLCVLRRSRLLAHRPLRCDVGLALLTLPRSHLAFELLVRLMQFAFSGSGLLLCARTRTVERGAQGVSLFSCGRECRPCLVKSEMTTIRMRRVVSRADRVISGLCGWSFGCVGRLHRERDSAGIAQPGTEQRQFQAREN